MSFQTVLKQLRLQDQLTQEELAKKLGVAKSLVSMWENGERKPSFEMLEAIADFFNVNMSKLLGEDSATLTPKDERSLKSGAVTDFLLSLPREKLRGILLALDAPAEVLSELDQQEPPQ